MNAFASMVRRNILVYIRNTNTIMFSLLGVIVIVAIFLLFGDSLVDAYEAALPGADVKLFVYQWFVAGVVAVCTAVVPLGVLGNLARDKGNNTLKDFLVSPVSTFQIALSYISAAVIVGIVLSVIVFLVGTTLLIACGAPAPGVNLAPGYDKLAGCLGIIILSVIMNSVFFFMVITFIQKYSTFTSMNVAISVIIGFMMGVAVPIGSLGGLGFLVKICGSSYPAAFLRRNMMSEGIWLEGMDSFRRDFGIDLTLSMNTFDNAPILNDGGLVAISLALMATFTILVFIRVRNTRRIRYGR